VLLNNPELCTSTSAVQFFFFCRWCDWSFCENCSIWAMYYLLYPCLFFFDFITSLPQITVETLIFAPFNYIKKCLLHNSVFKTMKRYHSKSTSGGEAIKTRIEGILKCLQFIINSNSKSLKNPCCGLYPTLSSTYYNVIEVWTWIFSYSSHLLMKQNM